MTADAADRELGQSNGRPRKATGNVLDKSCLNSLREVQRPGEADFVTELIDLFLVEVTLQLEALHEALRNADAFEIERLAHRLKGSSASLGATQLAALFSELEGKDSFAGARDVMAQLEREFELVREALKAERRGTAE